MAAGNPQVVLHLPVLRGSAWFSCTQPSGYVHDATSRQLERLHRAPPWMEPVDRRRPPRCHVGINPLTHTDCEASSLWRGGGQPNIGFNKETPEVGDGGNRQTRLGPFRSQAAAEGVRICAGGCRLPAPVPRSSPRAGSVRVGVRHTVGPILDPGNVLAVDLLSRDPRGNREQRCLRSLLRRVRRKGRCHGNNSHHTT